jgi:hypothetical protein
VALHKLRKSFLIALACLFEQPIILPVTAHILPIFSLASLYGPSHIGPGVSPRRSGQSQGGTNSIRRQNSWTPMEHIYCPKERVTLLLLPAGPLPWRSTVTPLSVRVTVREREVVAPEGSVVELL